MSIIKILSAISVTAAAAAVTAAKEYKKANKAEPEGEDNSKNDITEDAEDVVPEFEKFSGHKVTEVEELLNSVTHSGPYGQFGEPHFIISRQDFVAIKEKIGVSDIYIRNNYSPFCKGEINEYGEMVTFRIRDEYCVSNDGFFLIDGKWKYFTVNEVIDDYIRQNQCKGRTITPDICRIV